MSHLRASEKMLSVTCINRRNLIQCKCRKHGMHTFYHRRKKCKTGNVFSFDGDIYFAISLLLFYSLFFYFIILINILYLILFDSAYKIIWRKIWRIVVVENRARRMSLFMNALKMSAFPVNCDAAAREISDMSWIVYNARDRQLKVNIDLTAVRFGFIGGCCGGERHKSCPSWFQFLERSERRSRYTVADLAIRRFARRLFSL